MVAVTLTRLCSGALCAALVLLLVACSPSRSVRVEPSDRPTPSTARGVPGAAAAGAGGYVVSRGDTLYGIAFRHGQDYRELARRNQIAPPYTIYPGQTLQLGASGRSGAPAGRPTGSTRRSTGAGLIAQTERSAAPNATPAGAAAAGAPASTAAGPLTPVPATSGSTPSTSGSRAAPATSGSAATVVAPSTPAQPAAALPTGPVRWRWPTVGQTVVTFQSGDPTRQGIGIAGGNGQAVHAAGDGVVVYSGAGLIGYGELVIIKHSDEWLSAYGHNRKRLVNEGQAVKGGDQIAEMGRSGASRDMLHFEIRRNGKPVDPLALLPRR